ncbi:MAG: hypothetical protein QXQ81_09690 [Candidatus Thorarchaeota archaeon]
MTFSTHRSVPFAAIVYYPPAIAEHRTRIRGQKTVGARVSSEQSTGLAVLLTSLHGSGTSTKFVPGRHVLGLKADRAVSSWKRTQAGGVGNALPL